MLRRGPWNSLAGPPSLLGEFRANKKLSGEQDGSHPRNNMEIILYPSHATCLCTFTHKLVYTVIHTGEPASQNPSFNIRVAGFVLVFLPARVKLLCSHTDEIQRDTKLLANFQGKILLNTRERSHG